MVESNNESMMNWLRKYLEEINLIIMKPEIFNLPYDKIGNEIVQVLKSNFKIVDAFFNKIVDFNYFQYYFKEIKHELSEFHPNLGHSSSLLEFKTVLSRYFKKKFIINLKNIS